MTNKDDLRDEDAIIHDIAKNQEQLIKLIEEKAEYDTIHKGISKDDSLRAGMFSTVESILQVFAQATEGVETEKAKVMYAEDLYEGVRKRYEQQHADIDKAAEEVGEMIGDALSEMTGGEVEVENMGVIEAENEEEAIRKIKEDLEERKEDSNGN